MITIELKPWDRSPDTHIQLEVRTDTTNFSWIEPNAARHRLNSLAVQLAHNWTTHPNRRHPYNYVQMP